jgi:hypothetical protein
MRSIALLFLIIGIVLVSLGYQKELIAANKHAKTIIEYRFIPRNLYDEQFNSQDMLESTYADMFEKQDVFYRRF